MNQSFMVTRRATSLLVRVSKSSGKPGRIRLRISSDLSIALPRPGMITSKSTSESPVGRP